MDKPLHGGSKYTPELAAKICKLLAEGQSLKGICRALRAEDPKNPTDFAVRLWALDDVQGFASQYTQARDLGLDAMADEVFDISDDGTNDWTTRQLPNGTLTPVLDTEHVARSRLRFDARRWYLSKLAPKRYGDRLTQEITGPDGGPIVIDDTARASKLASILAVVQARRETDESNEANTDLG